MYNIYGKLKDDDKYKMMNLRTMEFVTRKLHASIVATWEEAERICYGLEQENPEYFFESRAI
jgi:hypothetical protein